MRRLAALMLCVLGVLAVVLLPGGPARADTLADCLATHHVCVTSEGRSLISQSQQTQLEQAIGNDDIYLVAAASGSSAARARTTARGASRALHKASASARRTRTEGSSSSAFIASVASARMGAVRSEKR